MGMLPSILLAVALAPTTPVEFVWTGQAASPPPATALEEPPIPYPPGFAPAVAAVQNGDQKKRRFIAFDAAGNGIATVVGARGEGWFPTASLSGRDLAGAAFLPCGDQHVLLIGGASRTIFAYGAVTDAWCEYGKLPPSAPLGPCICSIRPGKTAEDYEIVHFAGGVTTAGTFRKVAKFSKASWAVVGIYALLMFAMATYFIRKKKNANDYFRGGNRIPWYVAGMSIFATMLSSVTFIAIPTMTYISDWRYFPMQVCIFLVAPVAIYFFLPFFCRLNITSAYEYLERRFNLGVRLFGSAAFIVFMVCRVAVVTLLPAIALNAVTGVSIDACILICGALTIIYCSLGGLEAVIWSDFVQGIVLMGGALAVLAVLIMKTGPEGGHLSAFVDTVASCGKGRLWDLRLSFAEPVLWVVAVQGMVQNLAHYTSDQCIVQRYISTPDERATRRSIWFNGVMSLFSSAVFFAIGTALFTHYRTNPAMMDVTMPKCDSVFPIFMATELPPWLAGLVVAALFAATVSTLSANLNSAATAVVTDFIARCRAGISDRARVRCGQVATAAAGICGVAAALVLARSDSRTLFDTFALIVGILTSGMAGIFIVGVFVPRVKGMAAAIGLAANYAVCLGLRFGIDNLPFHPFLLSGLGLATCLAVSVALSFILKEKGKDLCGLTLSTL